MLSPESQKKFIQYLKEKNESKALQVLKGKEGLNDLSEYEPEWEGLLFEAVRLSCPQVVQCLIDNNIRLSEKSWKKMPYAYPELKLIPDKKQPGIPRHDIEFKDKDGTVSSTYQQVREAFLIASIDKDETRREIPVALLIFLIRIKQYSLVEDLFLFDEEQHISYGRKAEEFIRQFPIKDDLKPSDRIKLRACMTSVLYTLQINDTSKLSDFAFSFFMEEKEKGAFLKRLETIKLFSKKADFDFVNSIPVCNSFAQCAEFFKEKYGNYQQLSAIFLEKTGMDLLYLSIALQEEKVAQDLLNDRSTSLVPNKETTHFIKSQFPIKHLQTPAVLLLFSTLMASSSKKAELWSKINVNFMQTNDVAKKEFLLDTSSQLQHEKNYALDNLDFDFKMLTDFRMQLTLQKTVKKIEQPTREVKPPQLNRF